MDEEHSGDLPSSQPNEIPLSESSDADTPDEIPLSDSDVDAIAEEPLPGSVPLTVLRWVCGRYHDSGDRTVASQCSHAGWNRSDT